MAELESLATEEALDKHIARHTLDRLIMLSDGIFAIATTLAALELKLPDNARSLRDIWAASGRSLLTYAITFLIIAMFWIGNRDIFARLQRIDKVMTGLTLAMLCAVAAIPAAAHGVFLQGGAAGAFAFYAALMTLCGLINMAMWGYAAFGKGVMRAEVPLAYRRERVAASVMLPLLFSFLLLTPPDLLMQLTVPVVLAVILVRRLLIPRFFRRAPQKV